MSKFMEKEKEWSNNQPHCTDLQKEWYFKQAQLKTFEEANENVRKKYCR